jgi:PPP family 3-phenylpropionic acid transporter
MLPAKAFYFAFFAAMSCLMPYLVLHYAQLGLSGRQIGLLAAIPPVITLLAAPLWGGIADATRQHRRVLMLAISGSLILVFVLSLTTSLLWLLPVIVAYAFFSAPIMPLVDNSVMAMLGPRRDQYGKQRLWGAIGWGTAGAVAGMLIDRDGLRWAFYGFFLFTAFELLLATRMPIAPGAIGARFGRGLRVLLTNRRWVLFLITIFTAGIAAAIVNNFLFLFLDGIGASRTLMGFSLTVATLSELPIFFYSDRLLRRWGARGLLAVALGAYALRMFAYAWMPAPGWVLPISLLHGLSFSAMWVAGVSYASAIAPPGLGATAQGLFTGTTMGLGAAAGALLGGFLFDAVGPGVTFVVVGIAVLAGLAFFLSTNRNDGMA